MVSEVFCHHQQRTKPRPSCANCQRRSGPDRWWQGSATMSLCSFSTNPGWSYLVLIRMRGYSFFHRSVKVVPASTIRPFIMQDVPARDSELRRAYVEAENLELRRTEALQWVFIVFVHILFIGFLHWICILFIGFLHLISVLDFWRLSTDSDLHMYVFSSFSNAINNLTNFVNIIQTHKTWGRKDSQKLMSLM